MNTSIGESKEVNIYENRAYGIQTIENKDDNAYVEYGDDKRKEDRTCKQVRSTSELCSREDSWWYICLACFMCR